MLNDGAQNRVLNDEQIRQFIDNGFVRIERAFTRELADEARAILWTDTGCDPENPATWTRPVIRLGAHSHKPFVAAANTPTLQTAYDQLVGRGRWVPCKSMGTFPVRFPSPDDPGDTGWHIDMSFDWEKPDFMDWRANIYSKGRALLMLFLFSDVSDADAPTRIRLGSHLDIARILAPAGEAGLTMRGLVPRLPITEERPEVHATGAAGTVYLCHPFLVHAAQSHRGTKPKFMAQPPLLPQSQLKLDSEERIYSPVQAAIRKALMGAT